MVPQTLRVIRSLVVTGSVLAASAALLSCADDDEPPPPSPCATFDDVSGTPSFSADVMPVFQLSCTFSSCHQSGTANPAQGLALGPAGGQPADATTIAAVHASIVGADATLANAKLVAPGAPEASFLVAKLHYGDDASFAACGIDCVDCGGLMPDGNVEPMDQARRDVIVAWIKSGALND